MKFDVMGTSDTKTRRAPQGARGLKYQIPLQSMYKHHAVAPRKGRVG